MDCLWVANTSLLLAIDCAFVCSFWLLRNPLVQIDYIVTFVDAFCTVEFLGDEVQYWMGPIKFRLAARLHIDTLSTLVFFRQARRVVVCGWLVNGRPTCRLRLIPLSILLLHACVASPCLCRYSSIASSHVGLCSTQLSLIGKCSYVCFTFFTNLFNS